MRNVRLWNPSEDTFLFQVRQHNGSRNLGRCDCSHNGTSESSRLSSALYHYSHLYTMYTCYHNEASSSHILNSMGIFPSHRIELTQPFNRHYNPLQASGYALDFEAPILQTIHDSEALEAMSLHNLSSHPPMFEFTDGTCLQLAVLALHRLHNMLPTRQEAEDIANASGNLRPFDVRESLITLVRAFADFGRNSSWHELHPEEAAELIAELERDASQFYENEPDLEFVFLLGIIDTFSRKVHGGSQPHDRNDEFGQNGMMQAIIDSFENILESDMQEMFAECYQLQQRYGDNLSGERLKAELQQIAFGHVFEMAEMIQNHIQREFDQLEDAYFRSGDPTIGENIASSLFRPLHSHLEKKVEATLYRLYTAESPLTNYESEQVQNHFGLLYKAVASIFSYESSLLDDFWPSIFEESDDEEEEPEWQEYDPPSLVDVLPGPEHVSLVEISKPTEVTPDSTCLVCFESQISMRKINVCGHQYCEDCLDAQLQSQHAARYKCAGCRAEFLQE